jgi:hypothetical protein
MPYMLTQKVTIAAVVCLAFITAASLIAVTSNLTMRDTVRQLSENTVRQAEATGQFNYQLARAITRAQVFYYTRKEYDRLDLSSLVTHADLQSGVEYAVQRQRRHLGHSLQV